MDLVQALQQGLHNLRETRADISHIPSYADENNDPQQIANNIIADLMNLLETLFVLLNLPADGFVSITPERPNVDTDEEASSS